MKLLWGALAGGAVMWVWGAISWMALGWHHATFLAFKDEDDVARTALAQCPASGVYGLPAPPRHAPGTDKAAREAADRAAQARMTAGPIVTAVVQREGFGSVPVAMLRALLIYIAASGVMAWIASHVAGAYWDRVAVIAAIGLAAGLICRMPDWNWHGYSTSYTAVNLADHVIGAFVAGTVIAAVL